MFAKNKNELETLMQTESSAQTLVRNVELGDAQF